MHFRNGTAVARSAPWRGPVTSASVREDVAAPDAVPAPLGLFAELTHRCPLGCPYCSNPLALDPARGCELDTATWARVFAEAAGLGVLQVHLSGGEPAARRDLVEITGGGPCRRPLCQPDHLRRRLYPAHPRRHWPKPASTTCRSRSRTASRASPTTSPDTAAALRASAPRRRSGPTRVPLTINAVMHRANIEQVGDMVELALELGAGRVEIAHVQYYGWALKNRAALMPTAEQVARAAARSRNCAHAHHGRIVIDAVVPDYYARFPKPCVGGWGRRSLNVTPAGRVLPCHAAESFPVLNSGRSATTRWPISGATRRPSMPSAGPPGCGSRAELSAAEQGFRRLPLPGVPAHR